MTYKKFRPLFGLLSLLLAISVPAQTTPSTARLQRVLSHFDLGVSGIAVFTKSVSGTTSNSALPLPINQTQSASTTAGALVTIRGQRSPYVGVEFNYGYARYSQNYTCCNQTTVGTTVQSGPLTVQATANEYTLGYVVRPPHKLFGTDPYAVVGAGTIEFKPTAGGGNGLPLQARATYYYAVGVEALVTANLGVRAGFRQHYYLAPDLGQNFLQINKRTLTSEPQIGLFLHF